MTSGTAEQRMLVQSLRDLAQNEFADRAFEYGEDLPWENVELLAEQGFLGLNFDPKYGGGGMTEYESILMVEEIGRVCPDTAEFLIAQQMVAPRAIEMFGSEATKERYLPPVIKGEAYIAIGISEPEAGSDLKSMNTTVEERDGDLILDGEKIWVSEFHEAGALVVWAMFPDEGLGSVVVDADAGGVEVSSHYTNMAGKIQSHIYLNDVVVPEENVLTRGREAFRQQLEALNWERLSQAAQSNSMALCAMDKALEYAGDREQFGQPIGDFQGIEWKLADMATELQASRSLMYAAAEGAVEQSRVPDPLQSLTAKLYSAKMAEEVVSEALQIHGANGYQQGHPLEYLYRFARGYRFAGGTDEIQKNQIASIVKEDGIPAWVN